MSFARYFRRRAWNEERARELDAYLEEETANNIARGMTAEEARFAAQRKLGNTTLVREEIYDFNTVAWLESLWRDLLFGARLLRKNPGFSLVAILSLALGIGANAAIFNLLNAVRLRSLPIQHPEQLAEVRLGDTTKIRGSQYQNGQATNPLWEQIRERQQVFSGIFAWGTTDFNLSRSGEARYAYGLWVSGDFFRVLGVQPLMGRVFNADDDRRGCGAAGAVINERFWRREFASDPNVVGRTVSLNGHSVPIVGVTPASFFGLTVGDAFDVAVPICSQAVLDSPNLLDVGTHWWLTIMGRLKPGVTLGQATAQLAGVSPEIFRSTLPSNYPKESIGDYLTSKLMTVPAGAGVSGLREEYSRSLAFLLGLAGLVLLIACANLANLMLARADARRREIAVRLSLGASRARIVRQLLSEALLLAIAGTALAIVLANYVGRMLVRQLEVSLDMTPDLRVFGFMAGLALVTTLLFGLSPALRVSGVGPAEALAAFGRGIASSRSGSGMRRSLVVVQVAFSLVLLVGALLFARSLRNILGADLGFQTAGVVQVRLDATPLHLTVDRWPSFETELLRRVRALPGVDAASATLFLPLSGAATSNKVWDAATDYNHAQDSNFAWVSSDYFKTLNIRVLAGREFDEHDTATSLPVAIVNREFVRRLGLRETPIGATFWRQATPYDPQTQYQIVGIVENTKYRDVREPVAAVAFLSTQQLTRPHSWLTIVVRSSTPPGQMLATVRREIGQAAPQAALSSSVFEQQIYDLVLRDRLMAELSAFFGGLAALLAVIGLYGLMSYVVVRRTNEIGIRMALGADRAMVIRMILREALVLLAGGIIAGMILALATGRAATTLLFGLKPSDPVTLLVAAVGLASVSLAASYLPARRASRLDPTSALRTE